MSTMVDQFISEITKGLYEGSKAGSYAPTLVVGLGGTGLKVLRHLKKALQRHVTNEIRLLGIDSDDGENRRYPMLPALDAKELVLFDADAAVRMLARAERKDPGARHILDFLPDSHGEFTALHQQTRGKIQMRKGAGQFRRSGKLLFCSNVGDGANLDKVFRDLRGELMGLGKVLSKRVEDVDIEEGCRVFVVSSLAGGTGAGSLIDVLGLIRRHFDGAKDVVNSFCVLPGRALDNELTDPRKEKRNTRGNAIGVLRELQAFMLGQMGGYKFIFDAHTTLTLGSRNLLNGVYLIGDTMWNGTPVDRWMDLCQATAYFLYGMLGTGVGASQQAGAVNHDISAESMDKTAARVFNALGVGVLEYPVDEIGAFAFRSTVDCILGEWLDPKVDQDNVQSLITNSLSNLQIGALEDVQLSYDFTVASVAEARYLKAGGDGRKRALSKDDDTFVGMAEAKVNEIDGQLAAYDADLSRKTQDMIARFREKLEKRALSLVTGNQHAAVRVLEGIDAQIRELRDAFADSFNARERETTQVLSSIEGLKADVHKLDLKLDILLKKRQKLIAAVNRFLELRVQSRLEEHVSAALSAYEQIARELLGKVQVLLDQFQNLQRFNKSKLEELLHRTSTPGFVQHAMPLSAIPAWVAELKIPVKRGFVASTLDMTAILREALSDVESAIRTGLAAFNLQAAARKNTAEGKRIKGQLGSLEDSSVPLIHLVEGGPGISELQPQKFIVSDKAQELADTFPAPAGGKVTAVDIPNPHLALCARTLHEFAVSDWSEFEDAVRAYRVKPWYYQALPAAATLPAWDAVDHGSSTEQ